MIRRLAGIRVALCIILLLAGAAVVTAQNQWERVGAPETSQLDVRALVVDSAGTLYAGTYGHGVWRSADGDHWTSFSTGLTNLNITRMIMNSTSKTLFAGASNGSNTDLYRYKLDSDNAWESVGVFSTGYSAAPGFAVDSTGRIFVANGGNAYDPTNDHGYVYIYRSQDNGTSWTMLRTDGMYFIINLFTTPANVLIGDYQQLDVAGIERSLDGGQTWQPCTLDYDLYHTWSNHALTKSFGVNVNTGSIFVGFLNYNGDGLNLARTMDPAAVWTALPQVGPTTQYGGFGYYFTIAPPVTAIASRLMGDMFVGLGIGCGVWRSTDDGQSFTDVSLGLENKDVNALVAAPDSRIYAGTAAGIFRSTDLVPVELSEFSVE